MVEFRFKSGALRGVECEDILVVVEDNVITARSGDIVSVVDYSHGNMGCWKDGENWVINVFQEQGMESTLYSTGGMELDAGKDGMSIYEAMRRLVQYDYSYWRD